MESQFEEMTEIDQEIESVSKRIRLLEFENNRAVKRVIQTRQRIDNINKARERYLTDLQEHNDLKAKRENSLDIKRTTLHSQRSVSQEKRYIRECELLNMKQQMGRRGRALKAFISRNKQQIEIDDLRHRKRLHEAVVLSHRQADMRTKLLEDYKQKHFHSNYVKKVEANDEKRNTMEKDLIELAKKEQELLERLGKAQDLQQGALSEFEIILKKEEMSFFSKTAGKKRPKEKMEGHSRKWESVVPLEEGRLTTRFGYEEEFFRIRRCKSPFSCIPKELPPIKASKRPLENSELQSMYKKITREVFKSKH